MQLIKVDVQFAFSDVFILRVNVLVLAAHDVVGVIADDDGVEQLTKINLRLVNELQPFDRFGHILYRLAHILCAQLVLAASELQHRHLIKNL